MWKVETRSSRWNTAILNFHFIEIMWRSKRQIYYMPRNLELWKGVKILRTLIIFLRVMFGNSLKSKK